MENSICGCEKNSIYCCCQAFKSINEMYKLGWFERNRFTKQEANDIASSKPSEELAKLQRESKVVSFNGKAVGQRVQAISEDQRVRRKSKQARKRKASSTKETR